MEASASVRDCKYNGFYKETFNICILLLSECRAAGRCLPCIPDQNI